MKSIRIFSLLLLASCRSPQAAFQFAPTPPIQASVATVVALASGPALPAVVMPAAARAGTRSQPEQHSNTPAPAHPGRAIAVRVLQVQPAASETAAHRPQRARRHTLQPQQPLLEHTGAFVLGTALVVGGVVAGLLLGGWLGLGVGALVVVLGYYFVGVGVGGQHAWLEVFQEFFNL